jgi:cell division protein FtsW (lipid II flippase)
MYTGGLWGSGLGAGQPEAIPIAASDFVYAVLAEELGYVGCGLVLAVYLVFFYRGFRLADSLADPFSRSLATGLTAAFAMQTLFNLGGVTKALPLTGITLPFISHGGSSLVVSFAMLGMLMALSDGGGKAPARAGAKRRA